MNTKMNTLKNKPMIIKFYADDEFIAEQIWYSPYKAAKRVQMWIWNDGFSVECKGIRLYKDCKYGATDKCVDDFIRCIRSL